MVAFLTVTLIGTIVFSGGGSGISELTVPFGYVAIG
jgi:biotin transporter BioY